MSTQKGNTSRTRSQKYKNKSSFKNNMHDTSHRTKMINNIQVKDVCERCKEIIDWKIKYKKYKPLTQPKTCICCHQKTITQAYHNMCTKCSNELKQCAKCCESKEIVQMPPGEKEQLKLDVELKQLLQTLPERKRRTFIRFMNKQPQKEDEKPTKDVLLNKLNSLQIEQESDSEFSDECEEEDTNESA